MNSTALFNDYVPRDSTIDYQFLTRLITNYAIPITVFLGLFCNLLIVRNSFLVGDLTSGTLYMAIVGSINAASGLCHVIITG